MEEIEHVVRNLANRIHQTQILLLHGAWHGTWCWENWLGHFSSMGYEVHVFSLPGHGTGSCRNGHINCYTLGHCVNTLAAQVAQISPTPVVVVHSMRGAILQKYLESNALPGAIPLATAPARGIGSTVRRLMRRHPVPICKGLLTLNLYHWIATKELPRDFFLGSAASPSDVHKWHRQLVRETATLPGLFFPLPG